MTIFRQTLHKPHVRAAAEAAETVQKARGGAQKKIGGLLRRYLILNQYFNEH